MGLLKSCFVLSGLLLPAFAGAFTQIDLVKGWNLAGNGDPEAIDVASKFNSVQILTVWKWDKADSKWAIYAPSMTAMQLEAYALAKGFAVLSTINSKEGFWVNATEAFSVSDPLATPPAVGISVSLSVSDLASGWNLVASADKKTPSDLNAALGSSLNAASKGISTLWAWDSASPGWRFYAPSLEANGQLSTYITNKNYLPFTSALAATDGFWVNIGAATPITPPPSPTASLRALTFTSTNDWFFRVFSSTLAQNTPAADGSTRYRERRSARVAGGEPYSWTTGREPARGSDLRWNGNGWVNCPINFENTNSAVDANGISTFSFCNGWETGSNEGNTSTTVDVSARQMIDVYNEILAADHTNVVINSAASLLGTATFPTGSRLSYRTNSTNYVPAVGYYPGAGNWVYRSDALVGAGDATACSANPFPLNTPNTTLEQLISVKQGKPCIFGENTVPGSDGLVLSSGTRNESWGDTTLSMGNLGSATTYTNSTSAYSYYTTNQRLRVAFAADNVAKYYSCQERWNGSTRNCDLIGTGTYAVNSVGDARTMTFSGLPALFSSLNYKRVFIERGGRVYFGYLDTPTSSKSARLNLTGLNALFTTLGLAEFSPDVPITLSFGSYAGVYDILFSGGDSGSATISIYPSGATSCSGTSAAVGVFACSFTMVPTGVDGTTANINLGVTGTGVAFSGTANYYTGMVTGNWSNTGGVAGTFAGSRR